MDKFVSEFNQLFEGSASLKYENGKVELTIASRTVILEPRFEIVGAQSTGQLRQQLSDTHTQSCS
jgi:hypothetical protein